MIFLKKIVNIIDKIFLPSVESHVKKYERNKENIQKEIIHNLTSKRDELKDVLINTYQDVGSVSVNFEDYETLLRDLKGNKGIQTSYQEDVVKKDIMINLYKVKDINKKKWFLVVDMTNSPNIALKDYWEIK